MAIVASEAWFQAELIKLPGPGLLPHAPPTPGAARVPRSQEGRPFFSCQSPPPARADATAKSPLLRVGSAPSHSPRHSPQLLLFMQLLLPRAHAHQRFAARLISWLRDRPSVFLICPHKSSSGHSRAPQCPHPPPESSGHQSDTAQRPPWGPYTPDSPSSVIPPPWPRGGPTAAPAGIPPAAWQPPLLSAGPSPGTGTS